MDASASAARDETLSSEDEFERTNAARDASMGIGIVDDPYPLYHDLRAQCPVHGGTLTETFGFVGSDGALYPERRHVTVVGYQEVEAVLKDTDTYSSAWYDPQLIPSIGRSILHMDPPEHQRHRLVVQPAFSQQEMRWWQDEYVRPACHLYIDRFAGRGRADLYKDFCVKLPIHVIALALGLPTDDLAWFHANAVKLTGGKTTPDEAQAAVCVIEDTLRPLISERRANPGRDLISVIVGGEVSDTDGVAQSLAAANHYPARFTDPEVYDPRRRSVPNIAFGWGRHRCLGVHLARMELVTALDVLLDRLPNLRPDPSVEPARITGLMFRAPDHVWSAWDSTMTATRRDSFPDQTRRTHP